MNCERGIVSNLSDELSGAFPLSRLEPAESLGIRMGNDSAESTSRVTEVMGVASGFYCDYEK